MTRQRQTLEVEVEGRVVRLSNLDKIYWPELGLRKGQMIDYYVQIAPVLLPHLARRPVTLHRFPEGVEGAHWYETRSPPHPLWVRTQHMHVFKAKDVETPVIDCLASLIWATNAGAIELHPYLGLVEQLEQPTMVVFDLDPGPPAGIGDAARVALDIKALLDSLALRSFVKSSGWKGLHVVVPLNTPVSYLETKAFARGVARQLVATRPEAVTDVMTRSARPGKVFVDWSQNDAGKSTVAPYSLRGLTLPTVAMPLRWSEVEGVVANGEASGLTFLIDDTARRVDQEGDLWSEVLTLEQRLPIH